MVTKEDSFIRFVLSLVFILNFWSLEVKASKLKVDRELAEQIAKKRGVLNPQETLDWKLDLKDIPKDWGRVDNKYFSAFYPNCFVIRGEGGEDDPKIAPSVLFERTSKCPDYEEQFGRANAFSIEYHPLQKVEKININSSFNVDPIVYRQKLKINSMEAYLLAGLMDEYNEQHKTSLPLIRWQVIFKCRGKVFVSMLTAPAGKPSFDKINTSDYRISEDFRNVISTFKCK